MFTNAPSARSARIALIVLPVLLGSLALTNRPAIQAASGPTLTVDASADRHAINPDIYGITFWWHNETKAAAIAFAKDIRLPINRSGGDATTRYNWQVDSSNAGSDWYYMGGNGSANPTPGASYDSLVEINKSVGARSMLTIPIIPLINAKNEWTCSFPKTIYGAQQSYNPYVHPNGDDCGNGVNTSGQEIADQNPAAHDKPNDPSIQKGWAQHLVQRFGTASQGGVSIYQLDNEPSGWLAVHRDVHPQGVGYTEMRDLTVQYAAAIKAADPSAATLGPGDIPYAYNDCNNCGNDGAAAHNGTPLGKWYLQQMAAYEKQHGVRILDYYAIHYPGCCNSDPMKLALERITTFHNWIDQDYPGTKLAFDEYNWGDAKQFSNALLTAEGLGLFGRERVDMASYWGLDDVMWPVAYAFRMYRNYDGAGGAFGETSLRATSDDQGKVAVFGAQRSSDGALTLLLINKTADAVTSRVNLSNFSPAARAQVYTYSNAKLDKIVHQKDQSVDSSGFTATLAANAITLVVIPSATAAPTATTPTATTPTAVPCKSMTALAQTPVATPAGGKPRQYLPMIRDARACK